MNRRGSAANAASGGSASPNMIRPKFERVTLGRVVERDLVEVHAS
jgi:hypothetical protein